MGRAYSTLAELAPEILEHQGTGSIAAILLNQAKPSQQVELGDFTLNVELRRTRNSTALPSLGYAI